MAAMKEGREFRHGALGAMVPEGLGPDVAHPATSGVWVRGIANPELVQAGLAVGDRIVSVNGVMVRGTPDLQRAMAGTAAGASVVLRVETVAGQAKEITVTVIERSERGPYGRT